MAKDMVAAFTSVSVTTTSAVMTGSPYTVQSAGVLKEALLTVTGDAVTSLIEGGHVTLSSKQWADREVIIPFAGANIRTAPALPIPTVKIEDIDLPCPLGTVINATIINVTGATPVTPRFAVFLVFEN